MHRTGVMPNTDFLYEEFERHLASLLLVVRNTFSSEKIKEIEEVLNGFADRHEIQRPKDAIENPRRELRHYTEISSAYLASFYRDFGVGSTSGTTDSEELNYLARLLGLNW